jgi:very-short-patch-repair endonuclease
MAKQLAVLERRVLLTAVQGVVPAVLTALSEVIHLVHLLPGSSGGLDYALYIEPRVGRCHAESRISDVKAVQKYQSTRGTDTTKVSSPILPVDLARFLREVVAVSERQRTTVQEQIKDGFVIWCSESAGIPGVRLPYCSRPAEVSPVILEIARPPLAPQAPSQEAALEEVERHRVALAQWHRQRALYEQLFGARRVGEGMELTMSTALLRGAALDKVFDRHLVAVPAVVDLDDRSGTLSVRVTDLGRLESHWLPAPLLERAHRAKTQLDALTGVETLASLENALVALCNALGPDFRHDAHPQKSSPTSEAISVSASPAIMLRRRESSALLDLLSAMTDDLAAGGPVSEPFHLLLDPRRRPTRSPESSTTGTALALLADDRQRKLIADAACSPHTVIQGPPGTGKTHTIANLLSALLAEGKRVMVTAENERALHEVQGKMPESMRSLLLPLFRGGGADSLGSSVNDIIHRTSSRDPEEFEDEIENLAVRLEQLHQGINHLQAELRRLADMEFETRVICGSSMRLEGHLAYLRQQAQALELVDKYLSRDGVLDPSIASALIDLTTRVTDGHRQMAELSTPDSPLPEDVVRQQVVEIDEALRALPAALPSDFVDLVPHLRLLEALERGLLSLPSANWSEIARTASDYTEAARHARKAAHELRPDIGIPGVSLENPDLLKDACMLTRALSVAPVDDLTTAQLLTLHRQLDFGDPGQSIPPYAANDPAALLQSCEEGLRSLRNDRTGLLDRYAFDLATNGKSDVDRIIAILGDRTGLQPPDCPPINIDGVAPPAHKLLEQAEALLAHLQDGGKFRGALGTPSAVKRARGLITSVTIDGSPIDTLREVEWVVKWLHHQRDIASAERWMRGENLTLPAGVSLPQWAIAVRQLPEQAHTVVASLRLALEARGVADSIPARAVVLLEEARLAGARAVVAHLETLANLPTHPDVRIAGAPLQGRDQAAAALRALEAASARVAAAALLPAQWQETSTPLDASGDDKLTRLLDICAQAASVPGWARTVELSAQRVRGIQEQTRSDERRRQLLLQRSGVIEEADTRLAVAGVASPATQAAREALAREDWAAYRDSLVQIARERGMQQLVEELSQVRQSVASTHSTLLANYDSGDSTSELVLQRLQELEGIRDRRRAVQQWQNDMRYPSEIHKNLTRLHAEAQIVEQALAGQRCWFQVSRRLTDRPELASALSALSVAVQKVPKTKTAASYPSRMRAVQTATREAAPAIPAWVLSIDRAAEILGYPPPEERFDVIIVDEASQAWFPAMLLYALADQVIVVGDDLQTSPSVNSGAEENIRNLAKTYLRGHRLEDQVGDDLSLYDIASTMTAPNLLEDHFRCVPEIIDISMRLSYAPNGKHLRPVRVRSSEGFTPINLVRVAGTRKTNTSANEAEVDALADAVVRCHVDPAYAQLTFGVVVLGGYPTAHIRALQSRLLDRLGPEALEGRELEIGTAAQFQGAERDVMFISMLDVPNENGRMTAKPQEFNGRNRRFVQQLNVAVSRARDQLWVVHSFDASSLHPGSSTMQPDARLVLLQPRRVDTTTLNEALDKCDSEFERQVVRSIHKHDSQLRISTQVPALGYKIDIVVEDTLGRRLAVECDGDKYHGDPTKVRADLYRERVLERAGWHFYRFFASEWFADPQVHLDQISWLLDNQHPRHAGNTAAVSTENQGAQSAPPGAPVPVVEFEAHHDVTASPEDVAADEPGDQDETDLSLFAQLLPARQFGVDPSMAAAEALPEQASPVSTPAPSRRSAHLPTPQRKSDIGLTKKERNQRLAAALRERGKPVNGETWLRAKSLLAGGLTFEEAAEQA